MACCAMRRIFVPLLVLSLSQAIALDVRPVEADPHYPSVVSRSEREKEIAEILDEDVQGFDFVETPLQDVATTVEDYHKIRTVIDRNALKGIGIDATVPITGQLSGISLKSALFQILRPLGLAYAIRDEVLLITTSGSPQAHEVRCYSVGELLGEDRSCDELSGTLSRIVSSPRADHLRASQPEPYSAPTGAEGAGGRCIVTFGDVLIVRDTYCGHEEIEKTLGSLRDVLKSARKTPLGVTRKDEAERRRSVFGRRGPGGAGRPSREATHAGESRDPPGHDLFGGFGSSSHRQTDDPFGDFDAPSGNKADDPFGDPDAPSDKKADDPFSDGKPAENPFGSD